MEEHNIIKKTGFFANSITHTFLFLASLFFILIPLLYNNLHKKEEEDIAYAEVVSNKPIKSVYHHENFRDEISNSYNVPNISSNIIESNVGNINYINSNQTVAKNKEEFKAIIEDATQSVKEHIEENTFTVNPNDGNENPEDATHSEKEQIEEKTIPENHVDVNEVAEEAPQSEKEQIEETTYTVNPNYGNEDQEEKFYSNKPEFKINNSEDNSFKMTYNETDKEIQDPEEN